MGIDVLINSVTICFNNGTEESYHVGVGGVKEIHLDEKDNIIIEFDSGEVKAYMRMPFIIEGRVEE